jgi:hypothetical protein
MAKFELKIKAEKLRKKGISIIKIANDLGISKSTASLWCRDIIMTDFQKKNLKDNSVKAGHFGRIIGAEMNKKKRDDLVSFYRSEAKKIIGKISDRDLLIAGTALYWGEGTKTKNKLSVTNSDPLMIIFLIHWFVKSLGVKKQDFAPKIYINSIHKERAEKVLKFWSNLLDLPSNQFSKITYIKTKQKKVYKNYNDYYGILTLVIKKPSLFKHKTSGLIEALKEQYVGVVQW